ncbi:hypothetical protein [Paenibacillus lautus]|nr:hypothetical protein [Paenibacillus lautus]
MSFQRSRSFLTPDGIEVPVERHDHVIEMPTEQGGRYIVLPV